MKMCGRKFKIILCKLKFDGGVEFANVNMVNVRGLEFLDVKSLFKVNSKTI